MPAFHYKAIASNGEILQGVMDAGTSDEVAAKLQEQGHLPMQAVPADSVASGGLASLFNRGGIAQAQIGTFTQQMATLMGAGLPLDRALQLLIDLAENDKIKKLVTRVRDAVRGGTSLSDALEQQHGVFNKLYLNMVRAGEMGGTLDQTLARLAEYMTRSKSLRDGVVSAMIYPCILMVMAGGSLIFLLMYVIPKFEPIFADLGGQLPWITRFVLGMATILRYGWWVLLLGAFGFSYWMRGQMAAADTRLQWDDRFLRFGRIGDLIAKIDTARLTRTAGTLLKNGVPLLTALSISKNVLGNSVLSAAVDQAATEVKTGGGLAHALIRSKRFPKLAVQMISVGEETGQLDEMLNRVADTYDLEVKTAIDRLMAILVPALTVFMAGFIAMIVMSVVVAILSMNDLVG
jgi:general secretion pathway protein F